jgi:hypothetical protein
MSEAPEVTDRQIAESALAVLEQAIDHLTESRKVLTALLITQPEEGCQHRNRVDIATVGQSEPAWLCPDCGEQSGG